jgi:hypothetical protein
MQNETGINAKVIDQVISKNTAHLTPNKENLSTIAVNVANSTASTVLGALILPYYANQFVGGLGMIAATSAVSACIATGISLGLNLVFIGLPLLIKYKLDLDAMRKDCSSYAEQNPITSIAALASFGLLVAIGSFIGVYIGTMVMGQPLEPLLICHFVGYLPINTTLSLLKLATLKYVHSSEVFSTESQSDIAAPAFR